MPAEAVITPVAETPERQGFHGRIGQQNLAPLRLSLPDPVTEDSVLFSFADRPIQEALHLFREDRGNV